MILSAKLTRPVSPAGIIDRPRLYTRLDQWQSVRAIFIHAPAGYGKSTLASRWIDQAGLDGQTAWLSLTEGENELRQFVLHVAAALDVRVPGLLAAVEPALRDREGSVAQAEQRLLAALEKPPTTDHLLLVLDDLQRVDQPAIDAFLHRLVEQGPRHLHLMILSRQMTDALPARLVAHNEALALDKEDLRFTEVEVQAYLRSRGHAGTGRDEILQLTARSEGWIAALHLALLSTPGASDVANLLPALRGDRAWQARYLAKEVLEQQRPEMVDFLLQTSLLEAFNASLCAAVTGRDDAAGLLAEAVEADLFIIPLETGWYRYHHLFQDLLRQRLAEVASEARLGAMHQMAADWLAAKGREQAALRHLVAAGENEAAGDLMVRCVRQTIGHDPHASRRLFDQTPQHIWRTNPQLLLERAMVALLLDDPRAMIYLRDVEATLGDPERFWCENPPLLGRWLALRATIEYTFGDRQAASMVARRAVAYVHLLDNLSAGTLYFLLALISRQQNEQLATRQAFGKALAAYGRVDFQLGMVAIRRELARWAQARGSGLEANRGFAALLEPSYTDHPEVIGDIVFAAMLAVENSYWLGDQAQAAAYLRTALRLARQLGRDALIYHLEGLADLYDLPGAVPGPPFPLFEQYRELFPNRGMLPIVIDTDCRRLIAAGRSQEAWQLVQQLGVGPATAPESLPPVVALPFLQAAVAADVEEPWVWALLAQMINRCASGGLRYFELHLRTLACWRLLRHEDSSAATELEHVARLAAETGYVQVVEALPEVAAALPDWWITSRGPLIELTPREQQILALLAEDYTYERISAELSISINTVRTHVRHLYKKLGVGRRAQALEAARQLALTRTF